MPALALLVGIAGITVAWVAAAVLSDQPCSWMALVAAIDMAVLLRLTRAPAGVLRTIVAVLATVAAVLLTHWMIAATQMGVSMGMTPIASSLRLGPALAWQLMQLSLDRLDWIVIVSSLPLAAILAHAPARRE
jgi:hypothetical protein